MKLSLLDPVFLAGLIVVALVRLAWPRRYYSLYGALVSVLLIGLASPPALVVIGGITLFFVYPVHRLYRLRRPAGAPGSAFVVSAAVALLVLLLVFLKVARQFPAPLLSGNPVVSQLLGALGVSYFLFRAIGFLHIQTILPIDERSPFALLYYALFPPTVTSGPIQKFQDFRAQLDGPANLSLNLAGEATYRITRGLFRKLCLAFVLTLVAERLLAVPVMGPAQSTLAIVLMYVSFYFDFAGYSDIAIGFGLLLGIKVPENFRKPFQATTVTEFWRNWHITLVDWFRDNVFIPLGGMQTTRARAAGLAMMIMILCGLWHGVSVNFALWGIFHGSYMYLEGMRGVRPMAPSQRSGPRYWGRVAWTNARVAGASIFFLPDLNSVGHLLRGFVTW